MANNKKVCVIAISGFGFVFFFEALRETLRNLFILFINGYKA